MKKFISLFFSLIWVFSLSGQASADSTQYEQVRSLLNFYEYMLNSVGSKRTSTRDKETIITESYKKVFQSNEVQIEDDLLDNRSVITNKDVNAYLRDVDFFFQDIQFDFTNEKIERINNEDSSGFFLISFENNIKGISIEGNSYTRSDRRFMEVNYDAQSEDLKIASVYTTKVSRSKELQNWWMDLSYGWKSILNDYVSYDSITSQVLEKLADIDSLNLKGNDLLQDLEPLIALRSLKYLDISDTQIDNIEPLRYAKNLNSLIAKNSLIRDIKPLKYFDQIEYLNLSGSDVVDISPISKSNNLRYLNLSNTAITDFKPIEKLSKLDSINLSNTSFSDLSILRNNKNLQVIAANNTNITTLSQVRNLEMLHQIEVSETSLSSLDGLSNHPSIKTIHVNQTPITDLSPLLGFPKLTKIYADYSGISESAASDFMMKKPAVLVITNSEKILSWWDSLPGNWKLFFNEQFGLNAPTRENLIQLINLDSLDISNRNFYEIDPLRKFKQLKYLDVSNDLFTSFAFTEEMTELNTLVASQLPVESAKGLEKNTNLREIRLDGTLLKEVKDLGNLKRLETLDINNTKVQTTEIISLLNKNKNLTIIFQSEKLLTWWESLDNDWKKAFDLQDIDDESLHKLIEHEEISISDRNVTSLAPLDEFIRLKKISLNNVRVTNLSGLLKHKNLESITVTNGPLQDLEGISQFQSLAHLNVMNTAIEDIKDLDGMRSLKSLNCAGTGIKNLKGISELYDLEFLDISNTRVWKLQRLHGMNNLKKLICYNTRLRQHTIDDFQSIFPDCKIDFY